MTVAFWDEGLSLVGFVTVIARTVRVIFPSHRQSGTGSVVFTATCVTSALSQITSKTKTDTVYWVDFQLAQRKGLKFYQTRLNAVILYDALLAYCISKASVVKSEEIIYQKVYVSPRPPPMISYKDNWTCSSDSDVARSSTDIQRVELKPNTQLSTQGDLLQNGVKKSWNVPSLIATLSINRNMIMSQIQRARGDSYADTNPQNVAC